MPPNLQNHNEHASQSKIVSHCMHAGRVTAYDVWRDWPRINKCRAQTPRTTATVVDSEFSNNVRDGVVAESGSSLFMSGTEANSNGRNGVRAATGADVTLVNADANNNGRSGILDDSDGDVTLHEVQSCENNQTSTDGFDVEVRESAGNNVFNSVTCDTSNPDGLCNCTCH